MFRSTRVPGWMMCDPVALGVVFGRVVYDKCRGDIFTAVWSELGAHDGAGVNGDGVADMRDFKLMVVPETNHVVEP
jgi:hypothetical protein